MPMRRHLNSTAFLKSSWELSTQEINIMMQNWYIFQRILSSYISFVSIRGISCIQSQVEMRKLVSRCWIKSRPSPRMKVTDLNEKLNLTRITPGSQNRSWQMIKYQAQQRGLGAHSWIWYVIAAKPLSYNKGKNLKIRSVILKWVGDILVYYTQSWVLLLLLVKIKNKAINWFL